MSWYVTKPKAGLVSHRYLKAVVHQQIWRNHGTWQGGRIQGRRCLITGGTSGIGFAVAKTFVENGAAAVAVVGRSENRILGCFERLKQITSTTSEVEFIPLVADVGQRVPDLPLVNYRSSS